MSELGERFGRAATEARDALARAGAECWELFAKASSWREVVWRSHRSPETLVCAETGLAVRTRRRGRTGFAAAAGDEASMWRSCAVAALAAEYPEPRDPLPPPPLLGAAPVPAAASRPAPGWAHHAASELAAELARCGNGRVVPVRVGVREGRAAWLLHRESGFTADHHHVSAEIAVEAVRSDHRGPSWRAVVPVPDPQSLEPARLARSIVDRILLLERAEDPPHGVRDLLLDTAAAANLFAEVAALAVAAPPQRDPVGALLAHGGPFASPELTLRDRRDAGPGATPCDGEGMPARNVNILQDGGVHQRPATYWEAVAWGYPPIGGSVRPGYREPPRAGFAALEVTGARPRPPETLLAASPRLVYLLRLVAPPQLDPFADSFRLSGIALTLERGRVSAWHPVVEVRGKLSRLLHRIETLGTDSRWHQTARGLVRSPSVLIRSQVVG